LGFSGTALSADAIPPIRRVLPPEGLEIPADVRTRLEGRLAATKKRLDEVKDDTVKPDVEVFTKAVDLALIHRELYVEKDFAKADWALNEANKRMDLLAKGDSPWTKATGMVVEGYRSSIDGSAQPYGLLIPENHDFSKPCPLYVWLHGRGDKATDLHFLQERATKPGQITPPNAIVVHPFGRHCVGWKHAGEIDVLEVVESVKHRYKIDEDRIVLIGFSMGGAGAWHIGAHYADRWVAVSPGAGFVDVARYQKIPPEKYPPWYEQKLWGLYDVPDYVRDLFNTNVIAYSGEFDKQREAAVIMEEAFKTEGRELTHLIGPGVEHKYEPETLKDLMNRLQAIAARGRDPFPRHVHVQTRTLAYNEGRWVIVEGLAEHWQDSRVDVEFIEPDQIRATTKNVTAVSFLPFGKVVKKVEIDGQTVVARKPNEVNVGWETLFKDKDVWKSGPRPSGVLRKNVVHHGPIDDAFMGKFTVVAPTGKSSNPDFQRWCEAELEHFKNRWRALMRGELPVKRDVDVKLSDTALESLVLWGDSQSNAVIRHLADKLPAKFSGKQWSLGHTSYDGNRFVPAVVFPDPRDSSYYIVLNSGLTFREGHDRTNSLQNPKLPDWAIIDITQPPDAYSPGRIHDADFFDENWQLKRQPKAPE
jgi:pimeloyl-ACP methyl ester carboxylesterase